jgi:hypothetical protein
LNLSWCDIERPPDGGTPDGADMNQFNITIDGGQNEFNQFGIQLEEPMSNNVGKSLCSKPFGLIIDAAKQDTRTEG